MPATSHIMFTNDCHSFVMEQPADKRNASNRIPRPPNAFLLYRSDFLKRRAVPPEVERRQQNLSRIAGQCWNMLPDSEKAVWYSKAAVIRAEHRTRYPSRNTGPLDINRPSGEDKGKGSAAGHPLGPIRRSRPRQTRPYQSPYCEGMFAALHDSKISSQVSQIWPPSPTSALESPLSTSATVSPLSSPHLLPPFPSVHSNCNDLLSASVTYENPMIPRNKISSLDSGAKSIDSEIMPFQTLSGVGPFEAPYLTLRPDTFASCVLPQPRIERLPTLRGNSLSQISLSPPRSNSTKFSPAGHPIARDFGATDHLNHFNLSSTTIYPVVF